MNIFSPAKINLFLNVKHKRADGFHELETIMQTIDLGDLIHVSFSETGNIQIACNNNDVPLDENNTIWKAVQLFYDYCKVSFTGIDIKINKKIPVGAGLGGGSSNAISLLNALNLHYGNILSTNILEKIASEIGSDTTFFLEPGTWLCRGRGEQRIQRLHSSKWTYLLILPEIKCSTRNIYSKYIFDLTKKVQDPSLLKQNLFNNKSDQLENNIFNNLRATIFLCYPELQELAGKIEHVSEKKVFVTGSGSTLFMVFNNDTEAYHQKNLIAPMLNNNVKIEIAHSCVE